ncbi:hypothetical protein QE422_001919 [Chryseobacterium sp. SORGH_AS 447]|nr:hypothetical protein [Chryseobacterium sp. SORGH_AS_0447]
MILKQVTQSLLSVSERVKVNLFKLITLNFFIIPGNIIFDFSKTINMKNLKSLKKSDLQLINGGNPPECPGDTVECYYPPNNGKPGYWRCISTAVGCPN